MKTRSWYWTKSPVCAPELVYVVRRSDLDGWYVVEVRDGGRILMHAENLRAVAQ